MIINRNCPICNIKSTSHYVIKCKTIIPNDIENILSEWQKLAGNKIFFNYIRCDNCNLLYCDNYLDDKSINFLYSNMNENMKEVESDNRYNTQYSYFREICKYNICRDGYLEIGPDIGLLAKLFADSFNFDKLILVEPNLSVHSTLYSSLEKYNPIIYDNLDSINLIADTSLSLILMVQVLDHLKFPLDTLKILKRKLKNNGVIVAVTHDESSYLAKLLRQKWPPYCLQHPQIYNSESITNLFKAAGFSKIRISKSSNKFSINFLLNTFLKIIGLNFQIRIFEFNIKLKLGNIITFVRQ